MGNRPEGLSRNVEEEEEEVNKIKKFVAMVH
jgi:hypothetical protein